MNHSLTLGQVEAFRSVMLAGSVVGAARLMHVTQPGVSRSIALLEHRIGYKLFERRGRRLVPTAEAEMLYREVEPVFNSLDRIAQVAQDIHFQQVGALRIATLPALAQGLVPRSIARFLSTRPRVSVFLQSLPSRQIADLVATRQYEVGIIEIPLFRPSIMIEQLPTVQAVAVMRADHPLAKRQQISLRDLKGERMVMLSQHGLLRYQIDDSLSNLGVSPDIVVETPSSTLACALVAAGLGIAIVSRWTADAFLNHSVVAVPIRETLTSRFAIVFPDAGAKSLLAEAFANELRLCIEDDRKNSLGNRQ